MDVYKRIKGLLEGSIGFMKSQRLLKKKRGALDSLGAKFSVGAANKYHDAAHAQHKMDHKRREKRYAKKHGEGAIPTGRRRGDIGRI